MPTQGAGGGTELLAII